MANGITGDDVWRDRVRDLELKVERNTTKIQAGENDVRDFKQAVREDLGEIKGSVRDLRVGQRNLVMGLLAAAVAFGGAAVPLILLLSKGT